MNTLQRAVKWLLSTYPAWQERDGRSLPWMVFDRVVRPYSLAVSLATFVVTASILSSSAVGGILDTGLPQALIGSAAGMTTFLLWAGWWGKNTRYMNHGLLMATAVWSAVGAEILIEGASWPSGAIALCWAVASAGSWLLEVNDPSTKGSP